MKPFLRFFLCAIPALLCMILIFNFSSQSAVQSSETSGSFIHEILIQIFPEFQEESPKEQKSTVETLQFFVRKTAHFSIYALLSLLLLLAFLQLFTFYKASFSAFLCSALYAISDEIHQSFIPGRSCELRDVCIDSLGALTALCFVILIYRFICRYRKRHKEPPHNIV